MDLLKLQLDYIYSKFETNNSKGNSKKLTSLDRDKVLTCGHWLVSNFLIYKDRDINSINDTKKYG